jgi:hypothetical protein
MYKYHKVLISNFVKKQISSIVFAQMNLCLGLNQKKLAKIICPNGMNFNDGYNAVE